MTLLLRLLAIPLALAASASAAEVRLAFPAVERLLAEQVFSKEGRRYVRGNANQHCDFAYLEAPRVGEYNGQLIIKARFTGRTAVDVLGACVGMGDAFEVTIAATPLVKRGSLIFVEVNVTSDKKGIYARGICAAMKDHLEKRFGLDLVTRAREALENKDSSAKFPRRLTSLELKQVKIAKDALVLDLDFVLTVQ